MTLEQIRQILPGLQAVEFRLESGTAVPAHFHVTEIGELNKHFIDCGGTIRRERRIGFQLWIAAGHGHRLQAAKLLDIIRLSEEKLGLEDAEIEVEYQGETIGKYDLDFNGTYFILKNKHTACLAADACISPQKRRIELSELQNSCAPGSGCC